MAIDFLATFLGVTAHSSRCSVIFCSSNTETTKLLVSLDLPKVDCPYKAERKCALSN